MTGPRSRAGALLLALAALGAGASGLSAQPTGWSAEAGFGAWSVQGADDWLEIATRAGRRWDDGSRLGLGTVAWRRFGSWDHSLEADGVWRAGERLWVDGRVLVTPSAEIREEAALEVGGTWSVAPFAVGVGYRVREFPAGTNHSVTPRLDWYRGDLLVLARGTVTRTLHDTWVGAALGRAVLRLTDRVELSAGAAVGEEDFVVGSGAGREVRTLVTRTLVLGGEVRVGEGWSLRGDVTATASDPRLDRLGARIRLRRSF